MSGTGPEKKKRRFGNPAPLLGVSGSPIKSVVAVAGSPDSEDSQGFDAVFGGSLGESGPHRPLSTVAFSSPARPDRGPSFVTTPTRGTKHVPWVRATITRKEAVTDTHSSMTPLTLYAPETKRVDRLAAPTTLPSSIEGRRSVQRKITALADISTDLTEHKITRLSIANADIQKSRSQNKVMGWLSASQVGRAIGISTEDARNLQWLHGLAYFYGGESAQRKDNLFLGTKHANAQMAVFCEMTIQKILEKYPDITALYIQVEPVWEDGIEDIRLPSKLCYSIKNGRGDSYTLKVTFDIDPLSMDLVNKNDTSISDAIAHALFQDEVSYTTPMRLPLAPRNLESPPPPLVFAPPSPTISPILPSGGPRGVKRPAGAQKENKLTTNSAASADIPLTLPYRPSFH